MQASMLRELFTKPVSAAFVRRDARDGAGPSSLGPDFGEDGFGVPGSGASMHNMGPVTTPCAGSCTMARRD